MYEWGREETWWLDLWKPFSEKRPVRSDGPRSLLWDGVGNPLLDRDIPESTSSYSTSFWYGTLVGGTGTPSIKGAGTLVGM